MLEGKIILLRFDDNNKYINHLDKYNRLLAYVYLFDDNDQEIFFNAELIKQGYAFAYIKYPFKYISEFKQYEKSARAEKKGLWGK